MTEPSARGFPRLLPADWSPHELPVSWAVIQRWALGGGKDDVIMCWSLRGMPHYWAVYEL